MATRAQSVNFGAIICSAKPLSDPERLKIIYSRPRFIYYVVYPLSGFPIVSIYAAILTGLLFRQVLPKQHGPAILLGLFAFFYFALIWVFYFYLSSRRDYCVLHEKGIRIRLSPKQAEMPFDAIASCHLGHAPSRWDFLLRVRRRALMMSDSLGRIRQLEGPTLTIVMNDGTRHVFNGFLYCFDIQEVGNLLREWVRVRPHSGLNIGNIEERNG